MVEEAVAVREEDEREMVEWCEHVGLHACTHTHTHAQP